jgi:hypothetical protein
MRVCCHTVKKNAVEDGRNPRRRREGPGSLAGEIIHARPQADRLTCLDAHVSSSTMFYPVCINKPA